MKDNRYKVELTNFTHTKDPGHGLCDLGVISTSDTPPKNAQDPKFNKVVWDDIKAKADGYVTKTIASLKAKTVTGAKAMDDF